MATFQGFEEMQCWQKARELTNKIYQASNRVPFSSDFALKDQIRKAAVSVMSNIAEGFDRGGTSEFIHFLAIAKGSASEVRCQLYVAVDQAYIDREEFLQLKALATETGRMTGGLMKYLRTSNYKGTKFKRSSNSKLQTPNSKLQ